jgi:branched-chain amino acid transport system substrate-binding protein
MSWQRATRLLVVAAILGLGLTGCGGEATVGVLLASSGAAQSYGESMRRGIDLALEDAEEAGELPGGLQLIWGDSATDPDTAVAEFRRLASEGALLVVAGVTSGEARQLIPVLEQERIVCLSPSASAPSLTRDSDYFFRVFASDELEGERAGRFLSEDQAASSVLIFSGDSEHSRGIEPEFRQRYEQNLQNEVVGRVLLTDEDWSDQAADMLAAHSPESVYIIDYAERTLEVVELLREQNYDGTICLTSAFYSGELVDEHGDLLEGVFFPQPAFDLEAKRELVRQFVDGFRATYDRDPDIYAAHAYDAMRVALHVIRTTKRLDDLEVRKTMKFSVGEFPGVTGPIVFDDYGDVRHNPIMYTIRDGQVRNYKRFIEERRREILEEMRKLHGGLAGSSSAEPTPTE